MSDAQAHCDHCQEAKLSAADIKHAAALAFTACETLNTEKARMHLAAIEKNTRELKGHLSAAERIERRSKKGGAS